MSIETINIVITVVILFAVPFWIGWVSHKFFNIKKNDYNPLMDDEYHKMLASQVFKKGYKEGCKDMTTGVLDMMTQHSKN